MNAAFGIVPLMVLIGLLNLLGAGISQWAVPDALWQKQLVQVSYHKGC